MIEEIITQFKGQTFSSHDEVVSWLKEKLTEFEDKIREEGIRYGDVSAWEKAGKEFGYWRYFEDMVKEDFLKRILPNKVKINFSDIICSQAGWNECIDEIKNNANKEGINI